MGTVLLSIQICLSASNPDDSLASDGAEQQQASDTIERARAWTRLYDMNNI
ncbi:Ubiquitin-conjugating enzyme E2 N [Manis javanica]|nr:Ubiquitin-conjugating enzyme E2 N [Manis javanica]